MKKRILLLFFTLALIIFTGSIYATNVPTNNEYKFDINYTGNIIEGEEKNATVILEGTNATPYTNVRIKVDFISGPAEPSIIAYDSQGIGYNIVEIGYWGPESGFAVGGTFKNETPVVAKYPKAGTYVTRLSLIDKSNGDRVIVSRDFTQTVSASTPPDNVDDNTINDVVNDAANNVVDEIPQTGTSIWTYALIVVGIVAIIYVASRFIKK